MRSTIYTDIKDPSHETITQLLEATETSRIQTKALYERYRYRAIEIMNRILEDVSKPNNRLPHDYRGYIVNQVVGYLFGTGIAYSVDKVAYEGKDKEYEQHTDRLSRFTVMNQMDDADSELAKYMSVCGYAGRLLYVQQGTGYEMVLNIPPWECFFLENDSGRYAACRYYTRQRMVQNTPQTYGIFEWYENKTLRRFVQNENMTYIEQSQETHLFDEIPLVLFQNNEEELGDFEKVEPLIDAYDKIMSDGVNEIESFAHAYMLFKGVQIDGETIDAMKKTGGLEVDDNGDVKFITKEINDGFMQNLLDRLQQDIHKFSDSVDMTDEKFSGSAQSGESRKWKLLALENKASTKSRKFSKGLREQFKVLCTAWSKRSPIDYLNIFWEFKRNVPIDLGYIAEFATKMDGVHSKRTLLGQIPYIDDVDYEMDLIEDENTRIGKELEPLESIVDEEDESEEGDE